MSAYQDIINELRSIVKDKIRQRDAILDQIALNDVFIDKIDKLIQSTDKQIPSLLSNINNAINQVKNAYDTRVSLGCKSDLVWEAQGTYENFFTEEEYTLYKVVKTEQSEIPYYGLKYYRKPLNRDYGSNIISEFLGNISSGSTIISVVSDGGYGNISIGDLITDNIDTPSIFSVGNLPNVVGFGTSVAVGVTTIIQGNLEIGSNIFAQVGIGTTGDVTLGSAFENSDYLAEGTTVVGFGTTTTTFEYYDPGISSFISTSITANALILSNISTGTTSGEVFNVGIVSFVPSIVLSTSANSTSYQEPFVAIRENLDIDSNFNYDANPLDPITVGIINSSNIGLGHKSLIVNNGHPSGPSQWREVLQEEEPSIGAGKAIYYEGTNLWPTITISDDGGFTSYQTYASLGVSVASTSSTGISYAATPPVPPDPQDCIDIENAITSAEENLQNVIDENLPLARSLANKSAALRRFRDNKELETWGLLQGAAYLKKEVNDYRNELNNIESEDFSGFE